MPDDLGLVDLALDEVENHAAEAKMDSFGFLGRLGRQPGPGQFLEFGGPGFLEFFGEQLPVGQDRSRIGVFLGEFGGVG